MIVFGINESGHDAALTVIKNNEILFAAHSERYSKHKNDWFLNDQIIQEAIHRADGYPNVISYYENPYLKYARLFLYGGLLKDKQPFYKTSCIKNIPVKTYGHHYTHAAAGYYTSGFESATVVIIDSIGEFDTTTIWSAQKNKIKKVFSLRYPFSFGLFYSAFTQLVGLEPNKEEYILMGMAAYGDYEKYYSKINNYFSNIRKQKYNFHQGILDWNTEGLSDQDKFDIAASVQKVYEDRLIEFMSFAINKTKIKNLVFVGGCALNCSANTKLWKLFDKIWIMPNPGDAGSSLGAAVSVIGEQVNWVGPYLGHEIHGKYPTQKLLMDLKEHQITAVANGKAEFGPRAFGNRSILADPRDADIKNKVNKIKQREQFRPFAPVVLEEHANEWFDMSFGSSPYMQFTVKCKKPQIIPSVVHADGTSRVQTVNKEQHKGLYELLSLWYKETGVPVLLNTSLNIKNQPLLNDLADAKLWEQHYKHKIHCHA